MFQTNWNKIQRILLDIVLFHFQRFHLIIVFKLIVTSCALTIVYNFEMTKEKKKKTSPKIKSKEVKQIKYAKCETNLKIMKKKNQNKKME